MKVLLLGATGRLGRCVLRDLVGNQHTVHVLARYKERLPFRHPKVKVYIGNVSDEGHLQQALQGCEAVLNVLNISRNSDFPWSKLRTPVTLLSTTMRALINVMNSCQVKRIVVTTAWGVGDSRAEIPGWFRWLIDHSNIRYAYQDHERQEKLLRSSGLDWTIVRPTGPYEFSQDQGIGDQSTWDTSAFSGHQQVTCISHDTQYLGSARLYGRSSNDFRKVD